MRRYFPNLTISDYVITEEDIIKDPPSNMARLLHRLPGIRISGGDIWDRNQKVVAIRIDQTLFRVGEGESIWDIIDTFDVEDIGAILKTGNSPLFGSRSQFGGGFIVIRTKTGNWTPKHRVSINMKQLNPLGYQLPVEFYSPKYDSKESAESPVPDLRTTIYWKPNVVTDSEGRAELDFYTSDDTTAYTVIIEGVSDDGRLIHYQGRSSIGVK